MASSSAVEDHPSPGYTPAASSSTITMDPDFQAAAAQNLVDLAPILSNLPHLNPTTALQVRANMDMISPFAMAHSVKTAENLGQVTETKYSLRSFDEANITLTRFATAAHLAPLGTSEPPRRAVLYIHGGGFICGSVASFAPVLKRDILTWDTQVFAVGYRVAPENPAPGPVEDAYAALTWLLAHAAELGVDPARIVVMGGSAGGGIAAGLALLARDRELSPPPAKVVLVYPMLDDRTIGRYREGWPVRKFLMWTEAHNQIGWGAYLGEERAGRPEANVSIYDAPGRAEVKDLVGLPSTYIDVGGLDLFMDEDIAYAARLLEANVQTEFHLYPGLPHGFESAMTPAVVRSALDNRTRAICSV